MIVVLLVVHRSCPRSVLRFRHTRLSRINHTSVSRLGLVLKLVHRRDGHYVSAHNVLADVPRQFLGVVLGVIAVADVEDCVELFECESFRLRQEEVAVYPAEEIPACVPAEGAGGSESCAEGGPGEGDDEVEAPACRGCEGHADVTDVEREGLSGVGEGHGTFGG